MTCKEWIEWNEFPKVPRCPQSVTNFIWGQALAIVSRAFCRPHRPKVVWDRQFFYDFMWSTTCSRSGGHMKSSSGYSLAHILSTSSSKSAKRPSVFFLRFLCEIELSLQSRAHVVDHFPDRGAHLRKHRPSSGDHGRPLYPKKHSVSRPRVFSAVNRTFPIAQLLADDVIGMMMRQLAIDKHP